MSTSTLAPQIELDGQDAPLSDSAITAIARWLLDRAERRITEDQEGGGD